MRTEMQFTSNNTNDHYSTDELAVLNTAFDRLYQPDGLIIDIRDGLRTYVRNRILDAYTGTETVDQLVAKLSPHTFSDMRSLLWYWNVKHCVKCGVAISAPVLDMSEPERCEACGDVG